MRNTIGVKSRVESIDQKPRTNNSFCPASSILTWTEKYRSKKVYEKKYTGEKIEATNFCPNFFVAGFAKTQCF